jgi:pimeloyl-ACP methyl ester carboxylesterase
MDCVVDLDASPLSPGVSPVRIHYREFGAGEPLLVLHGGWGYGMYPFDRQVAALLSSHRVVVPDRTGYGSSGTLDVQRVDFHQRAAEETIAFMDAIGIRRAALWGHSDGAVIALRLGLMAPDRVGRIVAEATHFLRAKPASRAFFETMRDAPERLGDRVVSMLEREHGGKWRALISANGAAWLQIADRATSPGDDLYGGRLDELRVPVLLVHGARDPRTEPGELEALRTAIIGGPGRDADGSQVRVFPEGGHSPHSEPATADAVTAAAATFLAGAAQTLRPSPS